MRHPLLREYLEKSLAGCEAVRKEMLTQCRERGSSARLEEGLRENETEIEDLRAALALYSQKSL